MKNFLKFGGSNFNFVLYLANFNLRQTRTLLFLCWVQQYSIFKHKLHFTAMCLWHFKSWGQKSLKQTFLKFNC